MLLIAFFGPFLSAASALPVALTEGLNPALWTLARYVMVQQLEGNVLQPLIQKRAVAIPPALLVLSLVVMSQLFGFLGLLVATTLTAVLVVLVKRLYVEGVLDDDLAEEKG